MSTVRRDFCSIPSRDASATWIAIVDLITANSCNDDFRRELMKVEGIVASIIAEQTPKDVPIIVTCDGPRTRIYCLYDDNALDASSSNESKLGFDAMKGTWQVSLGVAKDDLEWVQLALKKVSSRVVARDAESGFEVDSETSSTNASSSVELDLEGFLKS